MVGVKSFQRILVDKGFDLGKFGPNKDGIDGDLGTMTRTAGTKWLKLELDKRGHKWLEKQFISIRIKNVFTDKFTDLAIIVEDSEVVSVCRSTTKPGKYWINNPLTVGGITGTGIQKEGQWINSHRFVAKGKRKWGNAGYFEQIATIEVYRDGNRDSKLDKDVVQKAPTWYGFFIHPMGGGFTIWNWSAGCVGTPLKEWNQSIRPFFSNGEVITHTIIEI